MPRVTYDSTAGKGDTARYSGTCPVCGNYIVKNRSRIRSVRSKWVHEKCYTKAVALPGGTEWERIARWNYPRAIWITGDPKSYDADEPGLYGPWALLAHCRALTITLHTTNARALRSKEFIDECGCGGMCSRLHEIIDLRELDT